MSRKEITDKMTHRLKRLYDGKHEGGSITPTCSCGWKGRPEYAYDDYQHTQVQEQEIQHLKEKI